VIRFKSLAADSITRRPVAVDPVKLIFAKPLWAVIMGPRASPPLMTFKTPAGKISLNSSPIRSAHKGVNGEGFNTMLLPANRAGAIFHTASNTGKFQGTIPHTTPKGT